MTATRSIRQQLSYKRFLSRGGPHDCEFCRIHSRHRQNVEETPNFRVIKNRFPYSLWDGQGVKDHLMIIPKRHTGRLSDLDEGVITEYVSLIGLYEDRGYNTYSRSPSSTTRSVYHYHTHLLLLNNTSYKLLLSINKPYLRFFF